MSYEVWTWLEYASQASQLENTIEPLTYWYVIRLLRVLSLGGYWLVLTKELLRKNKPSSSWHLCGFWSYHVICPPEAYSYLWQYPWCCDTGKPHWGLDHTVLTLAHKPLQVISYLVSDSLLQQQKKRYTALAHEHTQWLTNSFCAYSDHDSGKLITGALGGIYLSLERSYYNLMSSLPMLLLSTVFVEHEHWLMCQMCFKNWKSKIQIIMKLCRK